MRLNGGGHLTYCLNVHPGETLDDMLQAIRTHVPEVKSRLCPDIPFGLGLRISDRASRELEATGAARLREALADAGAYAFTVNAFPYGAFHGTRVKENVYLPDWSSPERLAYTLRVCRILAELLPEGVEGSVSTVPLGYKYGGPQSGPHPTTQPLNHSTNFLILLARQLAELEGVTGKLIHVGLEPEPDCVLETTEETVAFFGEVFRSEDEGILRRHLGVCLDTCHAALQFEDPVECLRRYRDAGIRVSKLQISAALETDAGTVTPDDLRPFDDGVYFHQTVSSSGRRWRDLPGWFADPDPEAGILRVHCHVPLDWPGDGRLRSTRHTLTEEFWKEAAALPDPHLEAETYTFGVLPDSVRGSRSVAEDMAAECRWINDSVFTLAHPPRS